MYDDVLFDIKERPVFVEGKEVPNKKAIINIDNQKVIGIVGKNYVPVLNKDILEHFCRIAEESKIECVFSKGCLMLGGSRTIMILRFPKNKIFVAENDVIELRGYLTNSFDGNSSARFEIGALRLICTNGMMGIRTEYIISYKHVGVVNEKLIKQFSEYLQKKTESIKSFVVDLKNLKFKNREQINNIINGSEWIAKKYKPDLLNQAAKLSNLNGWGLYNVFTSVITHHTQVNMVSKVRLYQKLNTDTVNWKLLTA